MAAGKTTEKKVDTKTLAEVPVLVKVLSVLGYISAGFMALLSLIFMAGAKMMSDFLNGMLASLSSSGPTVPMMLFSPGVFVILGLLMLGIAVLSFFIARGLWKGQNWARIVQIVLSCIAMFAALLYLIAGAWINIFSLAVHGAIAGYLIFNEDVKKAFMN